MLTPSAIRVSHRTFLSRLRLFVGLLLLFVGITVLPISRSAAAESTVLEGRLWLSGAGVDVMAGGDYSVVCVVVPGGTGGSGCQFGAVESGTKWQCVELVNRLYLTKGWITSHWYGNGNTLANNVPAGLSGQANGHISSIAEGDVITYNGFASGHAGVVNSFSGGSASVINQNAPLDSTSTITSGSLTGGDASLSASWNGYFVQAIIHHPGSPVAPPSPPAGEGGGNAASWAPDRMDVFYNGDSHMWHNWHDGAGWHAYEQDPPGGENVTLASQVAAVSWEPGRLDIFARSQSASLLHKWFINGAGWSHWEDLGGCIIGAPTVGSWVSQRLDIFVQGCNDTDVNMHHRWYDGSWHSWEVVPGLNARISSPPSAVSWGTNRLDIFARGEGSDLIHNWYDGSWHGADSQGGCIIGQPAVSAWAPGRLDVFVEDCNANGPNVSYKYYASNAWQPWGTIPLNDNVTVTSMLGAVSSAGNRIDVFARGTDGVMQHKWYDNTWNHWESLSGSIAP